MNALRALTRLLDGAQSGAVDTRQVTALATEMEAALAEVMANPRKAISHETLQRWCGEVRRIDGVSQYSRLGDIADQQAAAEQDAAIIRAELELLAEERIPVVVDVVDNVPVIAHIVKRGGGLVLERS